MWGASAIGWRECSAGVHRARQARRSARRGASGHERRRRAARRGGDRQDGASRACRRARPWHSPAPGRGARRAWSSSRRCSSSAPRYSGTQAAPACSTTQLPDRLGMSSGARPDPSSSGSPSSRCSLRPPGSQPARLPGRRRAVARELVGRRCSRRRSAARGGRRADGLRESATPRGRAGSRGSRSCGSERCPPPRRASSSTLRTRSRWTHRVRERIIAETRGNPLALLERRAALSPTRLAGGFAVAEGPPLQGRIEASFRHPRRGASGGDTAIAAARRGRAARRPGAALACGRRPRAGDGCGSAGRGRPDLIAVGTRVTFRYPLLRSAIYDAAPVRSSDARYTARWPRRPIPLSTRTADAWHRAPC